MASGMLGFLTESNLVLLTGAGALAIGGATLVSRGLRRRQELVTSRTRFIAPWSSLSPTHLPEEKASGGADLSNSHSASDREIVRRLGWLSIAPENALNAFFLSQLVAAACFALVALVLSGIVASVAKYFMLRLLLSAAGAVIGWFVPRIGIRWMTARRKKRVVASLPDALELLVICAEAGLALEEGIDRVIVELKRPHPDLAEELTITAADLKILPDRDMALARFADRVDQQNFRSVVTTLTQTMRYGTPLAQALRAVASEMRNESLINLEERANRLPALMTVPMMLFIMPTIFLIIGGPAILRLLDVFYH